MLTSFKEKLNAPPQSKSASTTFPSDQESLRFHFSNLLGRSVDQSTTPPGSPPADTPGLQQPSTAAPNTSSILAALANMARQQNTAAPPAVPGVQIQDSLYSIPNSQNNPAQQVAALNQSLPVPSVAPSVNVPGPGAAFASHPQGANGAAQNFSSNPSNPFTAAPPIAPSTTLDPAVQQQLMLIKTLSDAGVAPDQIAGVIAHLGNQGGAASGLLATAQFPAQNQAPSVQNSWAPRPDESRDLSAYPVGVRSPGQYRRRSRSPSPHRAWNANARDSPSARRRDESGYDHGRDSPGQNRDDRGRGRGGRGSDYRQRSPPRRGRSATPPGAYGGGEKWIGHDASIGKGNIKGMNTTILSCLNF
jgi:protein NRD1